MTVVLSGLNRLTLFSVIAISDNLYLKEVSGLYDSIGFSDEEISKYPKIDDIKIEIGENLNKVICNELIRLKNDGTITEEQMELYKIFVGK